MFKYLIMKKVIVLIGIFLMFGSIAVIATENMVQPLFTISENDIPDSNLPVRADKSIVKHSQFASINIDILGGSQNTYLRPAKSIILNISSNKSLLAILDHVENVYVGGYNWIGTIDGVKLSQVIFSVKNGIVAGKIIMPKAIYEIRYITSNTYAIQQLDQSGFKSEMEPIEALHTFEVSRESSNTADTCTEITVLVAYSTEAKDAAGGKSQIESVINLAISETNQSYINI